MHQNAFVQVKVRCPAKTNEFLLVGPKDARGYHPLRTTFQAVSLFDELTITAASADTFVSEPDLPERNTVTRAWDLLKEYAQVPPLEVVLQKGIPSQSGLGGGSSDAAGFLQGVLPFLPYKPKESDLFEIARAVGADVSFFLAGGRARGEGYGDLLTPLSDLPTRHLVIAQPEGVGCSTAEMYGKLDLHPRSLDREEAGNDFEAVAPAECLELIVRLRELGAQTSALTGSGSAVFAYFGSEMLAEDARKQLGDDTWAVVARTLARDESLVAASAG